MQMSVPTLLLIRLLCGHRSYDAHTVVVKNLVFQSKCLVAGRLDVDGEGEASLILKQSKFLRVQKGREKSLIAEHCFWL